MSEIIKPEATAVTAYGDRDPFAVYADSIRPGYIIGDLLKFSKGDYLLGEGAEPVQEGTVVVAGIDQLLIGWSRWENGKPVEHRMVLVASGEPLARRAELGYLDPARWEADSNGKPRDPWQLSAYLPLLSEAGELWTFSTLSKGGHGAIAKLSRSYAIHRRTAPDKLPRISLKIDSYLHPDRTLGRIKVPLFELAGWEGNDRIVKALSEAGLMTNEVLPMTADRSDDMNDSIPF